VRRAVKVTFDALAAIGAGGPLLTRLRGGGRPEVIRGKRKLISATILPVKLADNAEDGATVF
jgi:hypothetical protein